ncbi:nitronate monooxygenase [Paenibacillus sp. MWE-103]|uniref:Probable nitronate monooxygenase n=1 Tax=Paenibacillus artemisiicola TaxID=1172618 RepID=A0ABS3W307_9BACL|nr:nitronate monooxygenase [Paenibacillus artemisiicola]MBO7742679.1 nitronate monooxygenase [Paenibacillus artemisiicola]
MNLRLDTDVCRLFGIRYPLFLAGMAGGPGTAELAAAVSEAGGLGFLGAAYMEPEAIREAIRAIRAKTGAPFGVNLFTVSLTDRNDGVEAVQGRLDAIRDRLGIERAGAAPVRTPDRFEEQVQVVLDERVPVISTAFGLLPERLAARAREAGMRIVAMATTVREAMLAEQAGCDAVVAQGAEAGGHRGTFELDEHPMGAAVGTFALVPQIADRVRIPVIAAGGIMDGRGLVAALALGAQGAQLGTRFLTAAESGAQAAYRKALLGSTEESTVITKAFSGRPARGIRNAFVREWEAGGLEPLPFPTQNTATRDIRGAAAKQGNAEYLSLWAGQGTRMLTDGQRAADIVAEIVGQARAMLG